VIGLLGLKRFRPYRISDESSSSDMRSAVLPGNVNLYVAPHLYLIVGISFGFIDRRRIAARVTFSGT
jgi:hypothetical protein